MRVFGLILILCVSILGNAQNRKFSANGSLIVKSYTPKEIGGNAQIFGVEQDDRGLLYFANQRGVIEFDGTNWRLITVEDGREVSALQKDLNGVIHVAGEGVYGILQPNKKGQLEYVSKLSTLPDEVLASVDIRKMIFQEDKTILQSSEHLVIYTSPKNPVLIHSESNFKQTFEVGDELYVVQKDLGLYTLEGNQLKPLEEGYTFSTSENDVNYITKFNGRLIVATTQNGLFEIDEYGHVEQLSILENYSIHCGYNIHDKYLSFGTITDGIRVLDQNLDLVYSVSVEDGLSDPGVKMQFFDRENNLWLATNEGVNKIEILTPILRFDSEDGIKGTVVDMDEFQGEIYVAALDGLHKFNENSTVQRAAGVNVDCYGVRKLNIYGEDHLLIGEVERVLKMNSSGDIVNIQNGGPYDFQVNPLNEDEIIILHYDGIALVEKKPNGEYQTVRYIRNFSEGEPFNFLVEDDGTILIGTKPTDGIYKTHVSVFRDTTFKFEHIFEESGLPYASCYLSRINDELYVATDSGLYKKVGNRYEVSADFGIDFSTYKKGVHRISKDPEGNIWMMLFDSDNNYEIGFAAPQIDGTYEWNSRPFMRHSNAIYHAFLHAENGITWIGGDGLLRFDANLVQPMNTPFNALIRKVGFGNQVLYYGTEFTNRAKVEVDYSSTAAFTFNFSGASFIDETKTEYSYLLEGHSSDWSEWSTMTVKEYNLGPGTYTFKVKARNIYGIESSVAEFTFTILPPWYQTTWAYVLYFIVFIIVVYLAVRFSIRRVKKQNMRLEQIVRERTAEVVAQKEEVEIQKELVEEKNRDIMDSIRYAKHIQDAILPSDDLIKSCFKDAFVLYKPKDIVSGDFYWLKEKEDLLMFAAVDCTGHGVPGAFVSIVGNNGLNRAINEFNLKKPGEILDKLTELVEEAFKQQGASDLKDGMDIGLCVLDKKNMILEYAGANNPLYIIRDGELIETKANKQPIGAFENRVLFTTHEVELKAGDRIVLFSDGYADQFGGPRGKKLKYKTFKSILLDYANMPCDQARIALEKAFTEWKEGYEQIDDVCVFAVDV